jgi:hypothetical protein
MYRFKYGVDGNIFSAIAVSLIHHAVNLTLWGGQQDTGVVID